MDHLRAHEHRDGRDAGELTMPEWETAQRQDIRGIAADRRHQSFRVPGWRAHPASCHCGCAQNRRLKQQVREAGIPTIYANDNFGNWRSDAGKLLAYCLRREAAGERAFVEKVKPGPQDYFVRKPMHSAFYRTPLDVLLRHLGASSLIFTGLTTNSCILCSANDANMRDYKIVVAADCCAARSRREHRQALEHISAMADAKVLSANALQPRRFVEKARR